MGNGLGIRTGHFGCHVDEGLWWGKKSGGQVGSQDADPNTDFFIGSSNTFINVRI